MSSAGRRWTSQPFRFAGVVNAQQGWGVGGRERLAGRWRGEGESRARRRVGNASINFAPSFRSTCIHLHTIRPQFFVVRINTP